MRKCYDLMAKIERDNQTTGGEWCFQRTFNVAEKNLNMNLKATVCG